MNQYAPRRPRFNPQDFDHPSDARIAWRQSLSDLDVRALAADYWRGDRDQCSSDAWDEYQLRFPPEPKASGKAGKRRKGRKGRKA